MAQPLVFARMPQNTLSLVKRVCRLRGENVSVFVRRAVLAELARLSFLDADTKKALGVMENPGPATPREGGGDW